MFFFDSHLLVCLTVLLFFVSYFIGLLFYANTGDVFMAGGLSVLVLCVCVRAKKTH